MAEMHSDVLDFKINSCTGSSYYSANNRIISRGNSTVTSVCDSQQGARHDTASVQTKAGRDYSIFFSQDFQIVSKRY